MISNYLKVAFRSIFRNKLTAFINIAGLALAMACTMLIFLFIFDEVSYDKYNSKSDRIYRITRDFKSQAGAVTLHLGNVAPPIGPLLKNDFGEIESLARTINYGLVVGQEAKGELIKNFMEERLFLAEPDIFKIFDFDIISGDENLALSRPFTMMLSRSASQRYFGDETDIVARRLRVNNAFDLEVTGMYEDLPAQAHWHPEILVSFNTLENDNIYGKEALETNWGNNAFGTYVLLAEGTAPQKLESQLPSFLDKHFGAFAIANFGVGEDFVASERTTLYVQKVTDIHLRSHLDDEIEVNGNINNVYMMGIIGIFIVLIACFNFVNLSTARATKRSKEVGLRKVVGAERGQLIFQYLSESMMIALIAMLLSIGLGLLGLDWLNQFTQKNLSLNFFSDPQLFMGLVTASIFIGLLAGIYPAFVISGFRPALTLKGQKGSSGGKAGIRQALVVTQFSISVVLIIATTVTIQQLNFLNQRDLGFNKDQVITMEYFEDDLANSYDAFYNEMTRASAVMQASRSSRVPTGRLLDSSGAPSIALGDSLVQTGVNTKSIRADHHFINTFDIEMVAGRDFSKSIVTDDSLAFIINEAAAKAYGLNSPQDAINKDFNYGRINGKIVGIIKDFHFESLHQNIIPIVIQIDESSYNYISIKLDGKQTKEGLAHVEEVWKTFLPNRPFEFQFLDERYRQLYDSEKKESQLFTIFSGLAIFIACLGLFGLTTFNTLQRVKEIGIRKVLGASVPTILALLSKEIVMLIIVANVIAWPIAWVFMSKWLDSFAYHIDMSLFVYILAAIAAVIIALITVSSQTIKAAMTNPSSTLRYE